MPIGKRQQSTMLYTVILFVGLSILLTILAVVFYIQAEKNRAKAATLQNQMDDLASRSEIQRIGAIVGTKQPRKSRLGTMVNYLDETAALITGGLPEDTSAEVKVDTANRKVKEILELLAQQHITTERAAPKIPTNEFVELLINQQFTTATENFDETMLNELPSEKLEEIWKSTTDMMGSFVQQLGIRTESQLGYDVMLITCEFENGCIDVKIVKNDKQQIAGLFFTPTPQEVLEDYRQSSEIITRQQPYIEIDDPNTIGLVWVIEKLKTKLDNATNTELTFQKELGRLKKRFDDVIEASIEKEHTLSAEKEKYQQQVNEIKQDYNDLKIMLQQTSDQQVQTCMEQLEEERDNRKILNQQLLKTKAELAIAEERMKRTQDKLNMLVPPPDSEIVAYKPDGKIILIDDSTKIVHLNIGSNEHVYRGLTFSVYEKNTPIPRDGIGKAEIEVFNVEKNISAARITSSNPKNPVIPDDIIANLIWDSDKTNVFVVSGEFDLNADGNIDYEGADKIKALIRKWGGIAADEISIDTEFLILGNTPTVLKKPTFEEMEIDPMAMVKYEDSLQRLESYKQVQEKAETLSIPVFNLERFLYFIGYKTLSARAGAF